MRERLIVCALALGCAVLPSTAMADDPNDPAMRTAEARARDRAIIRRLNQEQLAHVRERDGRSAEGWRAYRSRGSDADDYVQRRAEYERNMAAWRRAVAACRAGDYSACDN